MVAGPRASARARGSSRRRNAMEPENALSDCGRAEGRGSESTSSAGRANKRQRGAGRPGGQAEGGSPGASPPPPPPPLTASPGLRGSPHYPRAAQSSCRRSSFLPSPNRSLAPRPQVLRKERLGARGSSAKVLPPGACRAEPKETSLVLKLQNIAPSGERSNGDPHNTLPSRFPLHSRSTPLSPRLAN